jgi:nucleotide-binding universal stress UspA family protein
MKYNHPISENSMYTNILYATDLSEEHFEISERAVEIARLLGAKLFILHVIELPASIQLAQGLGFTELANPSTEDAKTVLSLLGEALNIPAEQQIVEIGSVSEHIQKKVQELNCQLIIMGSHSPEGLPAFLGSTANAIIHHPPCDVMTLKV